MEKEIIEEDPPSPTQQDVEPDSISSADSSFVVFDGTDLKEYSEELRQAGLTPIHISYRVHLWGMTHDELMQTSPWGLPPQDRLVEQAHEAEAINAEIAVIDIEHWPIDDDQDEIRRSLQNYITVHDRFKQVRPEVKFGYYDVVPRKNWFAEKPQRIINKWRSYNDFLTPLADKVDVFFPNLYTYKRDQQYWVKSAKLLLNEARRIGDDKPVYAFLWPQYLSRGNDELRGEYLSAEFWRLQLQTVRKYADGAVVWFPYNVDDEEAFKAPWLEVTREFLQNLETESNS